MFWLIGAFGISTGLYVVLLRRLARYRTNLEPGGHASALRALWTGRALRPENYTEEGRQLLPWVTFASLVSTISFLAIGVAIVLR